MSDAVRSVPATDIRDRAGDDARPLDAASLVDRVESIGALGLLEPIICDQHQKLLAGAHRRAACLLLGEADGARRRQAFVRLFPKAKASTLEALSLRVERADRSGWTSRHTDGLVQVRIIPIDSTKDAAGALAVESAENTQRKQIDSEQLAVLVRRLKAAGFQDVTGRPARGVKALRPALSAVVGLSQRQIARILNGRKSRALAKGGRSVKGRTVKAGPAGSSWASAVGHLRAAVASCRSAAKGQKGARAKRLVAALDRIERALGSTAA